MTIHASSQFRVSCCFCYWFEENMLPYYRATEEDIDGIEEERFITYL